MHCKAMNLTQLRAVGKRTNGLRKSLERFSQGSVNRLRSGAPFLPADRSLSLPVRHRDFRTASVSGELPFNGLTYGTSPPVESGGLVF